MNFVFISPHFPKSYWNFCDRLKKNGVNVLGLADAPYDELPQELKNCLTEYYKVNNLENYDEVLRAMGYFTHKYGKIDWVESNNEYWLEMDAQIRSDFNITTGMKAHEIGFFKSKSAMKEFYHKAGVPVARHHMVTNNREYGFAFIEKVGYPVVVKPDIGVGAAKTYKLKCEEDVHNFYNELPEIQYIMEEFIEGAIVSFDGISGNEAEVIFGTSNEFPPSIMDIVNNLDHVSYHTVKEVSPVLRDCGERVLKAFNARNRFFHLEFFRLTKAKEGLGEVGDIVALEVNMRAPGGYTPDMINFANSVDVYQIWADMVAFGKTYEDLNKQHYFAVYCARRDGKNYLHSHEEIMERYGDRMVMRERMPEIFSQAMGNEMYTAKLDTAEEKDEYINFVLALA
ncbi:MAG: ATP-grasp domain-containing protein [Oscillospiraceae bacterium]|nr:ATP-grasp domain-containing protein [Oscillospiraceae bacterium]